MKYGFTWYSTWSLLVSIDQKYVKSVSFVSGKCDPSKKLPFRMLIVALQFFGGQRQITPSDTRE